MADVFAVTRAGRFVFSFLWVRLEPELEAFWPPFSAPQSLFIIIDDIDTHWSCCMQPVPIMFCEHCYAAIELLWIGLTSIALSKGCSLAKHGLPYFSSAVSRHLSCIFRSYLRISICSRYRWPRTNLIKVSGLTLRSSSPLLHASTVCWCCDGGPFAAVGASVIHPHIMCTKFWH